MTDALRQIQDCPLLELDMEAVGNSLAKAVIIARQLGHESAAGTIKSYWGPAGDPAHEFVRDVFTLNPDEIADRWMGGTANAIQITRAVLSNQGRSL